MVNKGFLKSDKSNTGAFVFKDLRQKPIPKIMNERKQINVMGDIHPTLEDIVNPPNSPTSIATHKKDPNQSNFCEISTRWESFFSINMDNNEESMVIEPDVKKTALHPIKPVINPPIAGPAMFPRPTNIKINPTDFPL